MRWTRSPLSGHSDTCVNRSQPPCKYGAAETGWAQRATWHLEQSGTTSRAQTPRAMRSQGEASILEVHGGGGGRIRSQEQSVPLKEH